MRHLLIAGCLLCFALPFGVGGCTAPRPGVPPGPAAPPPSVRPAAGRVLPQDVRDTVEARLARGRYVGLAVAVLDSSGRAVYGFGRTAKDSTGVPVTGETRFEIGSVTKTLTGLLLADAVERGEATLETTLGALLPDSLPPSVAGITLRQLTTHTSGLPRLPPNLAGPGFSLLDPYAAYGPDPLAAYLVTARPDTAAQRLGTVAYSNLGAGLLGHLLARRAGMPYADLLAARVTARLPGVALTTDVPARGMATGHTAQGRPTPPWTFTDALVGAGGVRASASSMLAYLDAQLHPSGPLAPALRRSHTVLARDGERRNVAYGWFTADRPDGTRVFWHNGGTGGFAAFVAFVPDTGRAVVVLSNVAGGVDDLGAMLLR